MTVHWLTPSGDVGWIRLRHELPVDARAERARLTLECAEQTELVFELSMPGELRSGRWELPGLTVDVTGDGQLFSFTGVQSVRVATGDGNDQVQIRVLEGAGAPVGLTATADLGGGDFGGGGDFS